MSRIWTDSLPRRLYLEYIRLLRDYDVADRIFRMAPDDAEAIANALVQEAEKDETETDDEPDNASDPPRLTMEQELATLSPMQSLLFEISGIVKNAAASEELPLDANLFVGLFPTGSLNAQSKTVPGGVLILVDSGLLMLVHELLGATMLGSRVFGEPDAISREEQIQWIADILRFYLETGYRNPGEVVGMPPLSERRIFARERIRFPFETFVVAHEFGHAIAGHLTQDHSVSKETPSGTIELVHKRREDEFQADRLGTQILLRTYKPQGPPEQEWFELDALVSAPLMFFTLDNLLTRIKHRGATTAERSILSDHPPALERSEAYRAAIREKFLTSKDQPPMQIADTFEQFFAAYTDDILKLTTSR